MAESRPNNQHLASYQSGQTVYTNAPSTPGSAMDQFVDAPQPLEGSHQVERQTSRVPIDTFDPQGECCFTIILSYPPSGGNPIFPCNPLSSSLL